MTDTVSRAAFDRLLEYARGLANAPVASGVCCCGSDMDRHENPMYCGHSPVDMWDHSARSALEHFDKLQQDPEHV